MLFTSHNTIAYILFFLQATTLCWRMIHLSFFLKTFLKQVLFNFILVSCKRTQRKWFIKIVSPWILTDYQNLESQLFFGPPSKLQMQSPQFTRIIWFPKINKHYKLQNIVRENVVNLNIACKNHFWFKLHQKLWDADQKF